MTLLTLLTVGIPTFGLALWAQPGDAPARLGPSLVRFVVPASSLLALAAFVVYLLVYALNRTELPDLGEAGVI
ncbi:MAG: hypothetical protein IT337_13455, partial [Thermomicrobiales bacterium]|nr:hypothetical protein [Thermomicrobiales bacterium]